MFGMSVMRSRLPRYGTSGKAVDVRDRRAASQGSQGHHADLSFDPLPSPYGARAYSVRSTAAGVRAAMRPGMAATRLPSTRAPSATATIAKAGTVGLGTT